MRTALALALCLSPCVGAAEPRFAATAFGGLMTRNDWREFFAPWMLEAVDGQLLGFALAARVGAPLPGLSVEIEGQVVRHFGVQDHWELNAPILAARWSRFPWEDTLDTSAAFGLGLSFASETPAFETAEFGEPDDPLAYWFMELDAGLPPDDWRLALRIHHRSTAFGAFGDGGGSNALVLGLRRLF